MILGFTGTGKGMTVDQLKALVALLNKLRPSEFHHGDCVGADREAHHIVRYHAPTCRIVVHPPIIDSARSFCKGDEIQPPLPYLERNRAIVAACDALAAAPLTKEERLRSGTWMTVRAARRSEKPIHFLWPET